LEAFTEFTLVKESTFALRRLTPQDKLFPGSNTAIQQPGMSGLLSAPTRRQTLPRLSPSTKCNASTVTTAPPARSRYRQGPRPRRHRRHSALHQEERYGSAEDKPQLKRGSNLKKCLDPSSASISRTTRISISSDLRTSTRQHRRFWQSTIGMYFLT